MPDTQPSTQPSVPIPFALGGTMPARLATIEVQAVPAAPVATSDAQPQALPAPKPEEVR